MGGGGGGVICPSLPFYFHFARPITLLFSTNYPFHRSSASSPPFYNSDKIGKIWKKSKLNSEKIWKIWKKSKSNSEKIWEIRKKGKLNSEMELTFLPYFP
jgi:hypothetical protein